MISRRAALTGGVIAAVAVTTGIARPPLGMWPSFAELNADHRTAVGQRLAIAPTTGVKVEMNSRTAVSLIDSGRGIRLVSGETFITAKPQKEAFRIESGKLLASTHEAQLNVQALPTGVRIVCISGQVDCEIGGQPAVLHANEQIIIAPDGNIERRIIDGLKATAWRRGQLIFEGAPLAEVVEQINIYRSGRIVLANASLGKLPVNAVFHTDRISDAVLQIEQLLGLQARHLAGGVVLIS